MADKQGRLAENILYFARALRAAGIPVGSGSVLDAFEAVQVAQVGGREDFYWTLHAVFVKRHEHSILFDQAFRIFFRKRGYLEKLIASMLPEISGGRAETAAAGRATHSGSAVRGPQGARGRAGGRARPAADRFRPRGAAEKGFRADDRGGNRRRQGGDRAPCAAARQVRTRRLAASRRGALIDMRRTLRASMKAGGALIDLKYLGPREKEPPIVALLDISGSMSQYTRLFLHFLHSITDARKRVTTFLFGTRLTNVTRAIRQRDPDEALAACSAHVPDWSGGTRIATSLRAFNRHWGRRVLGQGAVVLLITDGLERDAEDDMLGFEMDRLHRSCRRLIWLNPLLRFDGFEARARGVKTMLPHVDELRPIHNLESMTELVQALSGHAAKGN